MKAEIVVTFEATTEVLYVQSGLAGLQGMQGLMPRS